MPPLSCRAWRVPPSLSATPTTCCASSISALPSSTIASPWSKGTAGSLRHPAQRTARRWQPDHQHRRTSPASLFLRFTYATSFASNPNRKSAPTLTTSGRSYHQSDVDCVAARPHPGGRRLAAIRPDTTAHGQLDSELEGLHLLAVHQHSARHPLPLPPRTAIAKLRQTQENGSADACGFNRTAQELPTLAVHWREAVDAGQGTSFLRALRPPTWPIFRITLAIWPARQSPPCPAGRWRTLGLPHRPRHGHMAPARPGR